MGRVRAREKKSERVCACEREVKGVHTQEGHKEGEREPACDGEVVDSVEGECAERVREDGAARWCAERRVEREAGGGIQRVEIDALVKASGFRVARREGSAERELIERGRGRGWGRG